MTRNAWISILVVTGAVVSLAGPVAAQDGILTDTSGPIVYARGPFTYSNVTSNIDENGDPICDPPPLDAGCDDFLLQVAIPNEAAYFAANPTHNVSITIGWVDSTEDFDLYVQDPGTGETLFTSATSGNPEVVILSQPVNGSYRIRVLLFAVVNETYTGTIRLGSPPELCLVDAGTYINNDGVEIWSCNTHLEGQALDGNNNLFDHGEDGEPSIKITPNGINYISAIAGLPAGSGLWRSADACAEDYTFLGVPDANLGGGDSDVEVGSIANSLTGFYNVYTSSLHLANTTVTTSVDGGDTHAVSPYSNPTPTNDRQWNAAYGENTVYLSYRTLNTGNQLFVVRSDAMGLPGTYTNGPYPVYADVVVDATLNTQLGNMVADNRPGAIPAEFPVLAGPNGEGNVYHGFVLGETDVYVAVSQDFGVTWSSRLVFSCQPGSYANLFTWVTVDQAGNVYTSFSDGRSIYYAVSVDQGVTWSNPVRVSNGVQTITSVMPTMAAGSDGRIVLAWYGTDVVDGTNSLLAEWAVFFARINNATEALPLPGKTSPGPVVVEQVQVSHGYVHTGRVCWGLTCEVGPRDRALLECFDVGVNPDGTSSVAWGAFGDGGTRFTRQLNGNSSIDGMTVPDRSGICRVPPACAPPPPCVLGDAGVPGCDWCLPPGVLVADDESGDVNAAGSAQHDIEAVYVGQPDLPDTSELVFTLEMATLAADPLNLPVNSLWRVYFTNPDDFTSTGTPIDYFVDMATCDPLELPSFGWGWVDTLTGITTGQGSISGSFAADGTITLTAPRSIFNLGLGTEPQVGSTLLNITGDVRLYVGAGCSGIITQVDGTTNPGFYEIQSLCPIVTGIAADPSASSAARLTLVGANPFRARTAFTYTLPEAGDVKVAVYNPAGQLVRTLFQGERQAGSHSVRFDTERPGNELAAGVYFVRLHAPGVEETLRVVHVK